MDSGNGSGEPPAGPSLEPYIARLERFELFSTNQCYYIVGSNKLNTAYRIIKIDRTLIERPNTNASSAQSTQHQFNSIHQQHHSAKSTPSRNFQSKHFYPSGHYASSKDASPQPPPPPPSSAPSNQDGQHSANPKSRPLSDFVSEDPNVYSQEEIKEMLDMIHDGNRMTRNSHNNSGQHPRHGGTGGLKPIVKAYGIVGFIRFLDCYYLTLITKRAKVGSIGGNGIYTIKNTETIPLKPAEKMSEMEDLDPSSVLLSMWTRGKRSVGLGLSNREIAELRYQGIYQVLDLSKSFFFSYTYDLTRTLQENFMSTTFRPLPPRDFKDIYAWNFFLTREFELCLNSDNSFHWIMPIVHGAFSQRKIQDYGRNLDLILIARRSRHFAGTRYLKRGVSDQGKVANDVEHEQILEDNEYSNGQNGEPGTPTFSSYVQVRGSIPTFWTQESSVTMPKPPIELNRVDPTYRATQLHFEDLFERYFTPVLVLDLVKQSEKRPRESIVGDQYRSAVDYINTTIDSDKDKIQYCSFDYSHTSKHRQLDVSSSLSEISTWAVNSTGFFCSNPKWKMTAGGLLEPFSQEDRQFAYIMSNQIGVPVFPMEQKGVLRTNCIDCLDRTNVAQFSAGVEAVTQQLVVMGIRSQSKLDPSSNVVRVLIDMYVELGDAIALQYGGSEAHKKMTSSESNIMPIGKHKELLTSIRRYYSNAFTDRLKQDAINLFLGFYVPYMHNEPLWEMESDYYLHNFHVKESRAITYSMEYYRHSYGIQPFEENNSQDGGPLPVRLSRNSSTDNITSSRSTSVSHAVTGESQRVAKARSRVASQNEALSIWWRRALYSGLHQRMWIKQTSSSAVADALAEAEESLLPPRYERLYQPEKMAQFDRFFARQWATPLRSARERLSEPLSSGGYTFARVVNKECTTCLSQPSDDEEKKMEEESKCVDRGEPIRKFLQRIGYDAPFESSSKLLVEPYSSYSSPGSGYVGDISKLGKSIPEEYHNYCTPSSVLFDSPFSTNEKARQEFESNLREYSLKSDDVKGIRELSESAHVNNTIQSGPYRGLYSDESAVEFAIALQEQFNPMESAASRTPPQIELEVRRRGFDAAGVRQSVEERWQSFQTSERQYEEILTPPIGPCKRSDLTTAASLQQYASVSDHNTMLSTSDKIFLTGKKSEKKAPPILSRPPPQAVSFAKRAARLGINTGASSDSGNNKAPSLYPAHVRSSIPPDFQQINDDMFAAKKNQFMVFNGPALDSWDGTRPKTKILRPDDFFFVTSSY